MTPGRVSPRALPTRTPIEGQVLGIVMRNARSWTLSEVAIAARAILAVEQEAARARRGARWIANRSRSINAAAATAERWGKSGRWLELILHVHDAATLEPDRFGSLTRFMESAGVRPAWAWLSANRDDHDAVPPPPLAGRARELLSGEWALSDVNLAARALLAAYGDSGALASNVRIFDPARRRRQVMNHVARLWGQNADWLQKIFDVCEAAEAEPTLFGHLVGVMDRANRPAAAWARLGSIRDERRVLNLAPVTGRFKTLVLDPPWNEDNISAASGHDYAQMSFDDIRAIPVQDWADEDCHLYLWLTNNIIPLVPSLLESWGFCHKAFHTWVKETEDLDPKFGLGRNFRNTTEHFVFATLGSRKNLPRRMASYSTPTHHRWPVGRNSEKPEGFYDLVRGCSYPPYGEAFQRQERPDFTNLYQERTSPSAVAAE